MNPDGASAMMIIVAVAFAGAVVKGITTMGLGLLAAPVIALLLDVQTAILSLFLSKFLSDIAMVLEAKRGFAWRSSMRLWTFIAAGAIAIPVATFLLATARGPGLYLFLGLSILLFVGYQLHPRQLTISPRHETSWGAAFGLATGTTQGLTGVGGPYAAMYLYSLKLTPREFIFLSSVVCILMDFSQLGAILYMDLYDRTRLVYAMVTVVPVMVGTWVGIQLRGKLNPRAFKRVLLALLTLSGGTLLVRGVGGL